MKLKLNKESLVGFVTQHGEKMLFGAGVVGLLLFGYYALMRDTLDSQHQPDELIKGVTKTNQMIVDSPPPPPSSVVSYTKLARHEELDASKAQPFVFTSPLVDDKQKRSLPKVLPLKNLAASAGFGAFELKNFDAAAGSGPKAATKLEARTWAVVVGVVPVAEQTKIYADAFNPLVVKGGSSEEQPDYAGSVVYRVEITAENVNTPVDQLKGWEEVPISIFQLEAKKWAKPKSGEIVAEHYVDSAWFTQPLGPLTGGAWSDFEDQLSRSPEIPPVSKQEREKKLQAEALKAGAPEPEKPVADGEAGGGIDGRKKNRADGAGNPRGFRGPTSQPVASNAGPEKKPIYNKLFRFFDFSVKVGKRYRYRVQLGLNNPNLSVEDRFLAAGAKKDEILISPWSEPTPIVSIPYGNRVLAGSVVNSGDGQQAANLLLIAISKDEGLVGATKVMKARGHKISQTENLEVVNPLNSKPETIEFDFKTDAIVLDMRGGRVLYKDKKDKDKVIHEPGEVLLLDRTGNLIVHNEVDDAEQWKQNAGKGTPKAPPKPGPKKPAGGGGAGAGILGG